MNPAQENKGVIFFSLFGVDIYIHPISWLMLAILGGALDISTGSDLSRVFIFVACGMLCLLVHELGHALAGKWLTGYHPYIEIAGLGGLTSLPVQPRTRAGYAAVTAAGPLASLLLGIFGALVFGLHIGNVGDGLWAFVSVPTCFMVPQEAASLPPTVLTCYITLFLVTFWWSVFNLLPVYPLDGGRLLATFLPSPKPVFILGLVLSGALTLWSAVNGHWFNFMIAGYLAWLNIRYLKGS